MNYIIDENGIPITAPRKRNKKEESDIQKAIQKYAMLKRWLVIRINSGHLSADSRVFRSYIIANTNMSAGLADLLLIRDGVHLFLEVKKPKGRVSPAQKQFAALCEKHGANYHIVKSLADAQEILQQFEVL